MLIPPLFPLMWVVTYEIIAKIFISFRAGYARKMQKGLIVGLTSKVEGRRENVA